MSITSWLQQYGYFGLFFGLMLEYIALPFPGETYMTFSGYLIYKGHLGLAASIASAWLGTSAGMTVTYWIGRKLGYPFLLKFGPRFFLSPLKLRNTTEQFEKYGNRLLFFSYFIPGVRHFTGYMAGILNMPYRTFALYTYLGGLFWVSTFLIGGALLGSKWEMAHELLSRYGGGVLAYSLTIVGACFLYSRTAGRREFHLAKTGSGGKMRVIPDLVLILVLLGSTGLYLLSAPAAE